MKNEQQLASEIAMKALELDSLREQLRAVKMQDVPALKSKYENKYFIDSSGDVFYKVSKVENNVTAITSYFDVEDQYFSIDKPTNIWALEFEITEEMYKTALTTLTEKFNQL